MIPEQAVEKAARKLAGQYMIDDGFGETSRASAEAGEMWRNFRKAAELALSAAAPFMAAQWQPIETAPKDGTKIIVYTVHGEIELSDWFEIPHWYYEEAEGGLYRKVTTRKTAAWNSNNPTHWQPLPAAPIIADQGVGE